MAAADYGKIPFFPIFEPVGMESPKISTLFGKLWALVIISLSYGITLTLKGHTMTQKCNILVASIH
jgi:hypothetical protein